MGIRNFTSEDKKQINKLYCQLYPKENQVEVDLTTENFEAKYLPLCLEEDGEILGFIIGTIIKFGTQKYGYIEDLVIDEEKRGKGLGSQLVEDLLHKFNSEGVQVVFVSIDKAEAQNPRNFYRKFGFQDCENPWLCKSLL